MSNFIYIVSRLSPSIALLLGAVPAYAANLSTDTPKDEIIVTAARTAQVKSTIALSIDKLDAKAIDNANAFHPAQLLNTIAGVNIHRGSGQEHLTAIRSPVLTGGAGAGSFLYLQDGVPLRAAGFANVNGLFEAGSEFAGAIEVVKGPASVLYGSNAVHGMINVISETPEKSRLKVVTSTQDSTALTSTAHIGQSTSASVYLVHDGGFRAASGYDQQKLQIRNDAILGPWTSKTLISAQNLNQETAGFIKGPNAYKDEDIRFTNPNPEAYRDGESLRAQVRLDRDIGENTLLSLTPYGRSTRLEFRRHFVPGKAIEKNGHDSVGLLVSLYGPDYIIGLDGELTTGFLDEFQPGPTVFSYISGAHYDYTVNSTGLAAYGQKDFSLGEHTLLKAGARAEYTHYSYDNKIDSGVFGRFLRIDDRSDDFFVLTPKLSLLHTIKDGVQIYARLARGARAPQTSDLYSLQRHQTIGDIKVETLDSAELGLRARLGVTHLEISGFAMHKDNFFFRNTDGENVSNGKTKHLGIELSAKSHITPRLQSDINVTLADHTYDFTDIVGSASNTITNGDKVDTAPSLIANAQVSYAFTDSLTGEISWRHMGEYFTDPGNTKTYPGHDVFSLNAQWDLPNQVRLFGRIDNLLDAKYADRADFGFGSERYFPARPRTLFIGAEKTF